jgi:tetratricopeptide (TPR) repeat protein
MAAMLEEARSAVIKGDYLTAIAKLEALTKLDPNYPNAENLLDLARSGAKNSSQLAIDSGNRSELNGEFAAAAKQYQRAQQLDPSSSAATDALRRLAQRMQGEGEDVLKRAKAAESAGHKPDAISLYEKALTLLPPEHPSAKSAREALAALKGGA